ncbi:hypothetical protein J3L16_10525 [Alteromonas sp. 5E99-2]|uniref:hypothetical protein n=1 Tax=Alteromonas sp. 5E99-2 TaxID=2817683 RepID=UPI001A9891FC|nr:hypothetical protein [Alteromonas sp. 5E99-2]MBO1256120.1 hypothetical protein [Alteromonas sp. 5E99-2]
MKKLLAMCAFLACFNANAGLIEVSTSDSVVEVGDTLTVTLTGSGFTSVNSLSLMFDFDTSAFSFDASSLTLNTILTGFSAPVLLPGIDVASGISLGFLSVFAPLTDFEFSFDLSVDALGEGNLGLSSVTAGFQALTGGLPILEDAITVGASVEFASTTAVSTPATFALFGVLGLFVMMRRKA